MTPSPIRPRALFDPRVVAEELDQARPARTSASQSGKRKPKKRAPAAPSSKPDQSPDKGPKGPQKGAQRRPAASQKVKAPTARPTKGKTTPKEQSPTPPSLIITDETELSAEERRLIKRALERDIEREAAAYQKRRAMARGFQRF